MKRTSSSHRPLVSSSRALFWLAVSLSSGAPLAQAADRYWSNGGTDFGTAANWLGGVPSGTNDRAIFSVVGPQPNVGAAASVGGLTFYSPGVNLSGPGPLTLLSSVTNSDFGVAAFAANPGVTTISGALVLGAPAATGSAGFSSVLGAELIVSGDISGSRGLQKVNYGTLTLSGNNTFSGGASANGGNGNFGLSRLNINSDTALGTGTFTIGQGNGGSTVGNTSGSARTLANAVALGAGSGVASNWDLANNGSGDLTFTGLATLTGSASAAGTLNVMGGTLTLRGGLAESAATQSFTKTGAGTLAVVGAIANTGTITLSGGGFVVDMSTGGSIANTTQALGLTNTNFTIKGAAAGTSSQTLGNASFGGRTSIALNGNGGAGTSLLLGNTWTRNSASTLAVQLTGNATLTASPAVSSGGLVIGSGTAAFATVTDAGGTGFATVSGGNVVRFTGATIMNSSDSGSGTNYVTRVGDPDYFGGSTLTLSGGNRAFNSLHLDTSGGAGTLQLNGTSLTFTDRGLLMTGNNPYSVDGGVLGSGVELVVHQFSTGALTVNALIGGVAVNGASVTKDGPGTLVLAGANLYTNLTTANEGTIIISGSLRGGVTASGATVATAGTISLQSAGAVGSGIVTVSGAGQLNQTIANAISGTSSINVNGFNGGAVMNLSHANSYSGQTALQNGTLNLGDAAAVGTGTLNISGGRLDNTSGAAMTLANNNPITLTGGLAFTGTHSLNLGTGAVSLGTSLRTLVVFANTLTMGGSVSGTGGITKVGAGTLTLGGANNYTGATNVDGGLLMLTNPQSLPGGTGTTGGLSALSIRGGVVGLGAGDFLRPLGATATDVQWTSLGGGFAAYGANRAVNLGGASAQLTWTVGGFLPNMSSGASTALILGASSSDATVDFQNPIILGTASIIRTVQVDDGSAAVDAKLTGGLSNAGGTVGFTKVGAGTLELGGGNSYNGVTSVAAGKLLVSGELTGTAALNVAGGATLAGGGSITTLGNGPVALFRGATLAPGNNGVGTLLVNTGLLGQLDLSGAAGGTGAFQFELGVSSDQIALLGGTLNIGAGVMNFDDFVFTNTGGLGMGVYTLVDSSSPVTGELGANLTGTIGSFVGTLSISEDTQDLVLTVVPEPAGASLLLAGLGFLCGIRRRKN